MKFPRNEVKEMVDGTRSPTSLIAGIKVTENTIVSNSCVGETNDPIPETYTTTSHVVGASTRLTPSRDTGMVQMWLMNEDM